MHRRSLRSIALIAVVVLAAACGSSSKSGTAATTAASAAAATTAAAPATTAAAAPATTAAAPATTAAAPAKVETINMGAVPTAELGAIKLGEAQGIFAKHGIKINLQLADGGPAVVTGVISKQYDVGYVAYTPPLLAVAGGQPLRAVVNLGSAGPEGTNGDIVVKKGSFATFKDLSGKKIATNAPRSILSLMVKSQVTKAGGDGKGVEIVPLPFGEMARAVSEGKVDAAVIVEPFRTKAKTEFPDVVTIGDNLTGLVDVGSPQTVIVTSEETIKGKADLIANFKAAMEESVTYANAHLDDTKLAGADLAGLTPEQAKAQPLPPLNTKLDGPGLKPLLDLMVAQGWIEKVPDVTAFIGS